MLLILAGSLLLTWLIRLVVGLALRERRHQLKGILPNVSAIPLIGAAFQMRHFQPDNLHEKFAEYVQRYGKSFMATIFGHIVIITVEPRFVDSLLLSQQHVRKATIYGALRGWLGNGLLLSRGESWHTMRKIITPTFHFNILEQFIEVFNRQCTVLVDKLRPLSDGRKVVNIYPYIGLAALDIISETAMGVSINAQLNANSDVVQAVKDVTNVLATRFMRPHLLPPLLLRLCWPSGYRKLTTGVQCLRDFTDNIIQQRRRLLQQGHEFEPGRRAPLLDTLLKATMHDAPLTDAQIRDEVSTFIFEGHDTTTAATSFCLYLLSRHASVQQRLFAELHEHFGNDLQRAVVYTDFAKLHYLHCVVKESLRLYPPIPAVGRWLEKDLIVGNTHIPAGANVIVLLWQLLRDETLYKDPLVFRPERHWQQETDHEYSINSNIPFSAGPRNCIGQRFALFEVKTMVIKIVQNFELLPLGPEVQPSIKIVLRSGNGVNFGLSHRRYS
ncbi:cytochrome P450 4ae1 [Scaptodrosophila lebanonensis]|uniref:Cytochrome P450 4ae1 n=1 Tax=Drosophila lebanonensis TaxID=7225 RepID=A0A6J2TQH3_DROLE|nr:cytochrome P450 4ae1 [Scaptodrosophila lebanonensis]XP_030378279.1 cytochrome P450 4ae1 [Scaptodrosophila lebanonensis]